MKLRHKWTAEEKQILVDVYHKMSAKDIGNLFDPPRTAGAVTQCARSLRLSVNNKRTKDKKCSFTKICTKCHIEKGIDEFYRRNFTTHSICIKCRKLDVSSVEKKAEIKLKHKQRLEVIKQIIFGHYGNKCSCPGCTETNVAFLTIEHINGGGNRHRKQKGWYGVCKDIIDNGFPPDYAILCFNCNCGKMRSDDKNTCPHLLEKKV